MSTEKTNEKDNRIAINVSTGELTLCSNELSMPKLLKLFDQAFNKYLNKTKTKGEQNYVG